jgi:murein DD-endopeptidase MepM/ murein hydrolase activator NlpD
MGKFVTILVALALVAGGVYWFAGRSAPPTIEIAQPAKLVGPKGQVEVRVTAPQGKLTRFVVTVEQDGKPLQSYTLSDEKGPVTREADQVRYSRSIGKKDLPDLKAGPARVVVRASRPVLFGLREVESSAVHEFEVRLTPPTVGPASSHHYINLGGSEMIVYRVSADAAESGVRVGETEYPGYPASGAGVANAGADLRVAFFALMWNQDANTPIALYARDAVGNEARATFDYRVFPKKFRKSTIPIDDRFLQKVVPIIVQNSPDLKPANGSDYEATFVQINRELRAANNAKIAQLAKDTAPEILWRGEFKQLVNTAVEAGFADQRTYTYQGREIDQQVHLGFDLASLSAAPVQASNRGKVVFAGWLGIYGNCVILDHGMGLQSLYAHLSAIDVKVGDIVDLGARLGRTGATGLAAGDHLHFTMLLHGVAVTPVDWWSKKWVEDRVARKIQEAGG